MFKELQEINSKPEPFESYTADDLWTEPHTSKMMLEYHLNESVDLSSRNMPFIRRSVGWIVEQFGVDETTSIVDFGCGPGLYTTLLAERHAKVTGVDFSDGSLQYARNTAADRGLNIDYVQQNYVEFQSQDRFDLIIMIMCDFGALSPAQRRIMVEKFFVLLKPGGKVLLDVQTLSAFNRVQESASYSLNQLNGFWAADDYYGFMNIFKYEAELVSLDKYTIFSQSGKRVVFNWTQYFTQKSLQHEFESAGFRVADCYADVAGTPLQKESPEMAIVAVKPPS